MYIIKQNADQEGKMSVYKTVKGDQTDSKVVATVTLLNLIQLEVTDKDEWTPPTQLQIDNLRRVFGIDIQFVEEQ